MMQNDRSKFEQLDADVKQLVDGVSLGHIGGEAKVQLENLLGIHDDALSAIYQERILKTLRFDDMGRRYQSVVDSHHKTFRWIFEQNDEADANKNSQPSDIDEVDANKNSQPSDDTDEGYQSSNGTNEDLESSSDTDEDLESSSKTNEDLESSSKTNEVLELSHEDLQLSSDTDEDLESSSSDSNEGLESSSDSDEDDADSGERLEMKHEAREKFSTWLSSPTGIFHVSGKLGSGKSTLMKFLYASKHTRAGVEKWAGKFVLTPP